MRAKQHIIQLDTESS